MLSTFGPIALFVVVAVIFPVVPLLIVRLIAPHRPNRVKVEPYESGMETIGPTLIQFPIRYYLYALIFVIFDVEAIFLFPFALAYARMFDLAGVAMALEMGVFVLLLLVAFAYAWRKRAFEWQ